MDAEYIGYLAGTALIVVAPIVGGIWLWVAGNRRIRNGGRYTMKYWGIGLSLWALLVLVDFVQLAGDGTLASTPEPKPHSIAAEEMVDFVEEQDPGTIEEFCSDAAGMGVSDYNTMLAEAKADYTYENPSAKEIVDAMLSRCRL
jgi:hypothetical protein